MDAAAAEGVAAVEGPGLEVRMSEVAEAVVAVAEVKLSAGTSSGAAAAMVTSAGSDTTVVAVI